MTLAGCGFYHILSRADVLFSPCSWEAEWKWNTHSHPFAWGLIRSRCLSQILELILQAKPDFVALSGSPCRMYYEDSHCSGNTFAPTPSAVPLPVCTLPRPIWWKREKKKTYARIHCLRIKNNLNCSCGQNWTSIRKQQIEPFFVVNTLPIQKEKQVFRLWSEKL